MLVNSVFHLGDVIAGKSAARAFPVEFEVSGVEKRIAESFDDGEFVTPLSAVNALPEFLHLRTTDKFTYNRRKRITGEALKLLELQGLAKKVGDYYLIVKPSGPRLKMCTFRVNFYAAISAELKA